MSAKIYQTPTEIKLPVMDFANFDRDTYDKSVKEYEANLRTYLKEYGYKGKNAGEIIHFPVADSTAQYMVIQMRPLKMFHLPIADAWTYQYVHLLTAKEIQIKIDTAKEMAKLFS